MRIHRLVLLGAAGVYSAAFLGTGLMAGSPSDRAVQEGKTTRDGVYTAEQAARGKAFFEKTCAKCHVFEVDPSKPKLEGPPLGGQTFFNNWEGKSVYQVVTSIRLGMPPDGSVSIDAAEAADLVAFILESNKLPAGPTPLVADATARNIKIAPPGDTSR